MRHSAHVEDAVIWTALAAFILCGVSACARFAFGQPVVMARAPASVASSSPGYTDPLAGYLAARMWMDPTATNGAGLVNDSSQNANHGTPTALTWTTIGTNAANRIEHANAFNGSTSKITINSDASLYSATNFAVSVWMNPTGAWGDDRCPLGQMNSSYGDHSWSMYVSGASLFVNVDEQGASSWGPQWQKSFTLPPVGSWTHIVFHFGDDVNTYATFTGLRVWTNGVALTPVTTHGVVTSKMNPSAQPIRLGVDSRAGTRYWSGLLDDFRIYTNVPASLFTDAYVLNLYQNTLKPGNSIEAGY